MHYTLFEEHFTSVHFAKGDYLTRAGDVEHNLYYIEEGIVRYFYYNPESDKETTVDFTFAGEFCLSYASYVQQTPSLVNMQALEEITAYKISREELEQLLTRPDYLKVKVEILEKLLIEKMQKEAQLLTQSPEENYRYLLEKESRLLQSVPLKYIASYIGITPQALSRIRNRIVHSL